MYMLLRPHFKEVVTDKETGLVTITTECPYCEKESTLPPLLKQDLFRWHQGTLIQKVFPNLTAYQRELLISGMDDCFDVYTDELKWEDDIIDSLVERGEAE